MKSKYAILSVLLTLAFVLTGCVDKGFNSRDYLPNIVEHELPESEKEENEEVKEEEENKEEENVEEELVVVGEWEIEGDKLPTVEEDGQLTLTTNENWQWGRAWYTKQVTVPFTINFEFKIGEGTGADGLAFFFLKDQQVGAETGEGLGLGTTPGYAIEFDTYNNSYHDPVSEPHIALTQNEVSNHLAYIAAPYIRDGEWHTVSIDVTAETVDVTVDDLTILQFEGTLDTTFDRLGFSASTGNKNDTHMIKSIELIENE